MKQISVEIIHKCPNRCLHCSSYSDINCKLKIETEKVKEIIDSAFNLKAEVLSISGGEPFLHTDLTEIVGYSKKKGLTTHVYTSGIMINDRNEADSIQYDMLKRLYDSSVDKIIFDLPAMDEAVYDKFMGTSGYQKFVFDSIHKTHDLGIYTEIHFVPTKINKDEVDPVLHFAEEAHVDKISFLGLVPHGRAIENKEALVLDEEENMLLKLKLEQMANDKIRIGIPLQLDHDKYSCYAGANKLCIRFDGKVVGCEAFKYIPLFDSDNRIVTPDSIYEHSLEYIYNKSEYLKYERKFIEEHMSECNCKEKCPVQRMMRKAAGLCIL